MYTTLTSPHNLRDTKLRDYLAEMRDRERLAPSDDEDEQDENRHVCRTCARYTGLDVCDQYTLCRLHLRLNDICAIMSDAGICTGNDDYEVCAPSLVLAEDDTCGEWEPCA